MPSAAELIELRRRAGEAAGIQSATEIREWMDWPEIHRDMEQAAHHRAALRDVQGERNAFEVEQARRQLSTDKEIAKARQRDTLDAIKAKDKLRSLSSSVAFLGAQYRARRQSLTLAAAPAVAGVLSGSVQAQNAWSHVLSVGPSNPVFWVLYLLESLATAPLVAILIYQAGKPGGSASAIRKALDDLRKEKFFAIEAVLLGISIGVNVVPHLILRQWAGVIWLWVPVAVVLSLWLLPQLSNAFAERILTAKTDAELSAPAGTLTPEQAKLLRQMHAVSEAEITGQLRVQTGDVTSGAGSIRKVLAAKFGSAGMESAQQTRDGLRMYRTGTAEIDTE
jgi:hypothetical protein